MFVLLLLLFIENAEMKTAYVDITSGKGSDRTEWGNARYHAHYHAQAAFELELQWLVATGCILGELVRATLTLINITTCTASLYL